MWSHRAGLGAVQRAVGDDLGQADDPVVDLVSAPPLHYNTSTRRFNLLFRGGNLMAPHDSIPIMRSKIRF